MFLKKKKKLSETESLTYIKQILNGFKGLHEANTMHRDFKLANVLLHNNVCKIADLGFAKQLKDRSLTGTVLGTDETMAVAIVSDRFGNPIPDGSSVTITQLDERGEATVQSTEVTKGLTAILLGSGTTAGRIEVFASSPGDSSTGESVSSRRVSYREVPGPAVDVELVVDPRDAEGFVADGRMLVALRTTPIADGFGNRLVDGHLRGGLQLLI